RAGEIGVVLALPLDLDAEARIGFELLLDGGEARRILHAERHALEILSQDRHEDRVLSPHLGLEAAAPPGEVSHHGEQTLLEADLLAEAEALESFGNALADDQLGRAGRD